MRGTRSLRECKKIWFELHGEMVTQMSGYLLFIHKPPLLMWKPQDPRQSWIGENAATVLTRSCRPRKARRRTTNRTRLWGHAQTIGGDIMPLEV